MTGLAAALSGMAMVGGLLLLIYSLTPRPASPARPRRRPRAPTRLTRRTQVLLAVGAVVGLVLWVVTGWALALPLAVGATAGLPVLLSAPSATRRIARLQAMEEWTRSLAGMLQGGGMGVKSALAASLPAAPAAIEPEVRTLVARLRANVPDDVALRAFADDLDDPTGDLIASSLVLAVRRQGVGVASVLEGLAESVSQDVRIRRSIEAERAEPRNSARLVTIITLALFGLLLLNGDYIASYATPLGQVILAVLVGVYVALLVWMKRMTTPPSAPRFIGNSVAAEVDS